MENQFATFKPIELNPNPSKEEIAKYYLDNNMSTNSSYLDNFFNIPTSTQPTAGNTPVKSEYNIKELLKTSYEQLPKPVSEPTTTSTTSTTNIPKSERGTYIMSYLMNKGLTKEQSAGILGNLHAESNLNTEAVGDGGYSFGIAQWHKGRFDKLKKFALENKKSISDLNLQLDFLWHELQTSENSSFRKLLTTKTVNDAAKIFAHEFERMKTYSPKREDYALNYYNMK